VAQIGPQRVGIATLNALMKMIDSLLPPVTHKWVTLSDFFTHFTNKRKQRMALRKMLEVGIKLNKMLKDQLFFQILYYLALKG
jgi:hypothetical protein